MSKAGLGYNNCTDGGEKECLTRLMDKGTPESLRFFLARKTAMEMLRGRGYIVPDTELTRSLAEFRAEFGDKNSDLLERMRFSASLVSDHSQKILLIFCGASGIINTQAMKEVLFRISQDMFKGRVILVLQSDMNSHARKLVANSALKIETFHIADLLVNITKHVLMPKLVILTALEKQKLLKKFAVKAEQLPRMFETDATTKYYGLEKGQVVKVTYSSPHSGSLVTYRSIA